MILLEHVQSWRNQAQSGNAFDSCQAMCRCIQESLRKHCRKCSLSSKRSQHSQLTVRTRIVCTSLWRKC
jgi:hypothetical protein